MDKLLNRFISNFLIAAFIPALGFVSFALILFAPLLPQTWFERLKLIGVVGNLTEVGFIAFLLALIVGFTLSSLETFLLKVWEGYVLFEHFPFLFRLERRKARKLRRQIEELSKRIERLGKQKRYRKLQVRLKDQREVIETDYQRRFPIEPSEILPTRFGNLLKAAEYYSVDRYGIDAVPLWSRLIYVIHPNYYEKIDHSANELSFLVNSSVLGITLGGVALLTGGVILIDQGIASSVVYIIASGLSFFIAYLFHRASLFSVTQYGDMIRGAYDLFRFDLLLALKQELPTNTKDEKDLWKVISTFTNRGWSLSEVNLDYHHTNSPGVISANSSDETVYNSVNATESVV